MENAVTTYTNTALDIFGNEKIMKGAQILAQSDIIPASFRGKPANVLVAMDMAQRMNVSPMLVMQNLYVIQGKPSWSSKYLIATINASGRFTSPLQYNFTRDEKGVATACYAYAIDGRGMQINGPEVTIKMAIDEGWMGKAGSKWQTMPELMLRYRAASFFASSVCPDLTMGLRTEYEQEDIIASGEAEYEDKTVPVDATPEEKTQPVKSPKKRLWEFAVSLAGEEHAPEACKAAMAEMGVKSVTEDNLPELTAKVQEIINSWPVSDDEAVVEEEADWTEPRA